MQEINLLQNKLKDQTTRWESNNRLFTVILSIALVAVLALSAMFYLMNKANLDEKAELDQRNAALQTELDMLKNDLSEAISFQAQAQNIRTLLDNHIVWTRLVDEVAATIFVNSKYLSVVSGADGNLSIEGRTSGYNNLGKVLLALETSDLFQSVKLSNTSVSTDGNSDITFSINVMLDPQIFIAAE